MHEDYRPTRFNIVPPVVKGIVILNVIIYVVDFLTDSLFGIKISRYLALHHYYSQYFMPHQFVTYMFLHGDIGHIVFNMLMFWVLGSLLENHWGSKRFLVYYLITGIGAAIIHILYYTRELSIFAADLEAYSNTPDPDLMLAILREHLPGLSENILNTPSVERFLSEYMTYPNSPELQEESVRLLQEGFQFTADIPTVGASGAIYGVLLAAGMIFPNMMMFLLFLPPMKLKYVVILFGAIELYMGVVNNPGDNVAHFAHLGGMFFGFLLIRYWMRRGL